MCDPYFSLLSFISKIRRLLARTMRQSACLAHILWLIRVLPLWFERPKNPLLPLAMFGINYMGVLGLLSSHAALIERVVLAMKMSTGSFKTGGRSYSIKPVQICGVDIPLWVNKSAQADFH